jgi:16S rRNA (adenine(1408)-N(1))-methyltransferase
VTVDLGTGDGRAVLAEAAARPDRLVVAAAEALPAELDGVADLVTVQFPWGSLLRGLLAADPRVMGGLAGLLGPGGALRLLVSSTDRDRAPGWPRSRRRRCVGSPVPGSRMGWP